MKTLTVTPNLNISLPIDPSTPLSGINLIELGWRKEKAGTYIKDGREIFYDGVNWMLDGNKIETIGETR